MPACQSSHGAAPRPFGGAQLAAVALLLALTLAAPPPAAAVKSLSDWVGDAMITHFGGAQDGMDPSSPSFGTQKGSCGYGVIPKDRYPYFSTAAFAPSNPFYKADELNACGQCFQIACADGPGVCKTDPAGKPLSVLVMISDECPECGTQHIDVQSLAFAKMADPALGRIKVQYRRVECAPPQPMQVSVLDYRGAGGWLRLGVTNTGGRAAVSSLAVKGGGADWQPMTNSWGATWECPNAPAPPLSFKIVGDDGEEVTAENVVDAGGIAGGPGAAKAFETGVQFSITDPAYGKVTAFDGASDPMLVTSDTPGASDGGAAPAGGGAAANATATVSGSGGKAPPAAEPPAAGSKCVETPTPDGHSCEQQKGWGKCSEKWISENGYCRCTCGGGQGGGGSGGGGAPPAPKVQAYSGPPKGGRKLLRR